MGNTAAVVNEPVTTDNNQTGETPNWKSRPRYTMYHATKDGNGAASQWELGQDKKGRSVIFLQVAPQSGGNEDGNATFSWRNWDKEAKVFNGDGLNMQLGLNDVSELL